MVRFAHARGFSGMPLAVAVALAAASVCAVACEEGSAVAGASLAQGDGTGGAGSDAGSVGASDGAVEVSIVGSDGGTGSDGGITATPDAATGGGDVLLPSPDVPVSDPAASCAGKCGQAQPNKWKCQCDAQCAKYGDCCADYQQLCTGNPTGGPGPDPVQILGCLEKSCGGQVATCTADPLCSQFWQCAKACKESECLQVCGSKFDLKKLEPVLQPLLDCGQKATCFDGGGTTKPPPTGPVCGDKKCEQPENSLNCEKDCPNTPPGEAQKCLYDKCKDSYTACFKSQPCVAAVACINTGKPQNQCVNDQKTGQLLGTMLQCGYQHGCLGGSGQQPVCGNGNCETGETYQSCPKDCEAPPPPTDNLTKCVAEKCTKSYASCVANEGCAKALACYAKTGSIQQCAQGLGGSGMQLLSSLAQCAYQQGCLSGGGTGTSNSCQGKCGQYSASAPCQCNQLCKQFGNCCADYDALCAGGGTSPNSCQGKCGQFTPGAPCQCNGECGVNKNCCTDYEKVCAGPPPPTAVCGDGICTAPAESAQSCPKDCGSPPPPPAKPCKTKADCAESEICCGKADGSQVCSAPAKCQ